MSESQQSLDVTLRGRSLSAEARVEVVGDERYSHSGFWCIEVEILRLPVVGKKTTPDARGRRKTLTATTFSVC